VPGLLFLLMATLLIVDGIRCERLSVRAAMVAGIAMVVAIGMWIQYLWVAPGLLLSPFILCGNRSLTRRFVVLVAAAMAVSAGITYLAALIHLRMFTVPEPREWIASSAHGVQIHGFTRKRQRLGRSGFGRKAMIPG